jgi:hypothetical protein
LDKIKHIGKTLDTLEKHWRNIGKTMEIMKHIGKNETYWKNRLVKIGRMPL